jgi:hypothetical protein
MNHAYLLAPRGIHLMKCHLGRTHTLAAPIALLLGIAFNCIATHLLGAGTLQNMLMLPGDLGPAGRGQEALLLFWALTYAMLPLQVLGLHGMALRGRLVETLRPSALRGRQPGRHPRVLAVAISMAALPGIACLLFGTVLPGAEIQTASGVLTFLVINWFLLHLLMVLLVLSIAFVAASGPGAPATREHAADYADSRHATG